MESYIAALSKKTAAVREEGDYDVDGLLYCGKCKTKKQCRISLGKSSVVVGCMCDCANQEYEKQEEARRQEEERLKIDSLRLTGILDKGLRNCRFDDAEDSNLIRKCRRYAEHWNDMRGENIGLLLWGDTGSGKTYAAACIANSLIDKGIPAMITSFPRILSAGWDERAELLEQISRFPMLVLDDLGAERETGMSMETVYAVVDERYKSGKPLIVTTNLQLDALRNPSDMTHKRIYDRVLEMCTPVMADGASYRKQKSSRKFKLVESVLSEQKKGEVNNG